MTDVMLNENVSERAASYRMPGLTIYGNDPICVYDEVLLAAERARQGDGPTLVECLTYRRGGHKRDDPGTYRPKDEVEAWLQQDPLPAFRKRLLADIRFDETMINEIETEVKDTIDASVEFALNSEDPPVELALEHVYAE